MCLFLIYATYLSTKQIPEHMAFKKIPYQTKQIKAKNFDAPPPPPLISGSRPLSYQLPTHLEESALYPLPRTWTHRYPWLAGVALIDRRDHGQFRFVGLWRRQDLTQMIFCSVAELCCLTKLLVITANRKWVSFSPQWFVMKLWNFLETLKINRKCCAIPPLGGAITKEQSS